MQTFLHYIYYSANQSTNPDNMLKQSRLEGSESAVCASSPDYARGEAEEDALGEGDARLKRMMIGSMGSIFVGGGEKISVGLRRSFFLIRIRRR